MRIGLTASQSPYVNWPPESHRCSGCVASPWLPAWQIPTVDQTRSIHLFRIAQEATSNAIKHGRATNIIVLSINQEISSSPLKTMVKGWHMKSEIIEHRHVYHELSRPNHRRCPRSLPALTGARYRDLFSSLRTNRCRRNKMKHKQNEFQAKS